MKTIEIKISGCHSDGHCPFLNDDMGSYCNLQDFARTKFDDPFVQVSNKVPKNCPLKSHHFEITLEGK